MLISAFSAVPELVTEASVPGSPVVVVPTVTVAGAPSFPSFPSAPLFPFCPLCPAGIVKFKMAFCAVPELVTEAAVPGAPVVVLPIVTVAAVPSCPRSPSGIVKLRTGQQHEPEFVTDAAVPG